MPGWSLDSSERRSVALLQLLTFRSLSVWFWMQPDWFGAVRGLQSNQRLRPG